VDGDGDADLFCANLAHPRFVKQGFSNLSMLYINQGAEGDHAFLEERRVRGIRFQETHSDPALIDIDNDGDLDLSITCVYAGVPSALYQNDGRGYFEPVTFSANLVADNGWGQSWLDFDGDGDLDALIASGSGVRLFRNDASSRPEPNKWLRVRLRGKRNRFGYGARVTATALGDGAPPPIVRELVSARGTSSQDEPVVHFGLGEYKGKVRVTVRWPDTGKETRSTHFVNRTVTIKQR